MHAPCTQTVLHWLFWAALAVILVSAVGSALYLNKAMMIYGNTEASLRSTDDLRQHGGLTVCDRVRF